jgi:eukaryotic translation initiation factor 2C
VPRVHAVGSQLTSAADLNQLTIRSFRYSNCGLPLLNIDVGFSAFMSSGPAIDVIAKMIGGRGGPGGGRGGYGGGRGGFSGGGGQSGADLQELTAEQIRLIKNKLRGMKVSFHGCK